MATYTCNLSAQEAEGERVFQASLRDIVRDPVYTHTHTHTHTHTQRDIEAAHNPLLSSGTLAGIAVCLRLVVKNT